MRREGWKKQCQRDELEEERKAKKRDFVEDENDWSTRENFEEIKYN